MPSPMRVSPTFLDAGYPTGIRIEGEQPPITVGTVINLSGLNNHANFSVTTATYYNRSRPSGSGSSKVSLG
jgi:hypothetical protein